MNQSNKKMYKILAPIAKKDGGTYWMRVGTAYQNKDDSINAFMDAYPLEGKLQIREMDEEDLRVRSRGASSAPTPAAPLPQRPLQPPLPSSDVPF